jgi:hypothetical protein
LTSPAQETEGPKEPLSSHYSGYSVSSAGDVNGDGLDDLIVGASYADRIGKISTDNQIIQAIAIDIACTGD